MTVGSSATVKANFTDQGILDTHWCRFEWGDSTTSSVTATETNATPPASYMSGSCTASHNYAAPGTYTVNVTAFDNDGASGDSGAITITVIPANTAPALSPLSITTVKENTNATLSGTFTDQNSTGTHKVTYVWGDRSPNTIQTLAATAFNFSASHKYLNDNPSVTATVTVADSGGLTDTASLTFAVINVAPAITSGTVPASTKVLPGGTVDLSPGFTDVGIQDNHDCFISWGDSSTSSGAVSETHPAPPATSMTGSCTASHTYGVPGVYNGSLTVKDGIDSTVKTFKVIVDTPPTGLTLIAPGATANSTATLSGTFTDPDSTHKLTIAWGDGSPNTVINPLAAGVQSFSTTHKYANASPATMPDGYPVNVIVLDNTSLDSTSNSTTIKVN